MRACVHVCACIDVCVSCCPPKITAAAQLKFTNTILLHAHGTSLPAAAILSHLKNAGLEADRKEAKQRYIENMQAYTTNLLGRPLEKLHVSLLRT